MIKFVTNWIILFMFFSVSVHALEAEVKVETIEAEISTAPDVPTFISRTMPEIVEVHFEAREIVRPLADGKNYKFWSFNGTVPGPMVRVRLG
ncbi:MAG: nitrite reductase, copper-containing, partial [Nitrospinae bacterium]|nr:nitrite reductase, copper-containing [Nitrospinota bacterium]